MNRLILAVCNIILSGILATGLSWLLFASGAIGENFEIGDFLEITLVLVMIVMAILSAFASLIYIFKPPELIKNIWKILIYGTVVSIIILLFIMVFIPSFG